MRASTSAIQACGSDVVELRGHDQRRDDGGPLGASLRSGEQPCLPTKSKAPEGALGRVVRQADPTVIEEADEGPPAPQHVIDRLDDG